MLSEPECRVLSRAFDLMLADFDPKDAVNYLLCSGVLSENLAEKIESKATRLERMRELLRIYRRRATGCEPLISYFEYAAQEHIANSLRTDLEHIMDGPSPSAAQQTFSHSIRLRKLLAGNVPRVWKHVKREKLQNEVAEVLRKRADLDSFFVVLHGIAGSGKSSLAASVFADVPDLLGSYFESIVWLRDSDSEPSRLFSDLLLLLWDDATSDPPKHANVSPVYLNKHIQEALVDKPNVIVVLDDVVQQETVTWASQLGLRFLVTTRNAELFASVSCSVDVVHVGSLTVDEGKELFFAKGIPEMEESEAAQSAVNHALSVCSGNAALLNMLKKLSSGEPARLSMFVRRLVERGLSSVKVATPYEYKSMHDSLTVSVGRLSSEDRDTLACAAILPSEVDIPLAVWALVVPVDVVDTDESEFLMLLSDRLSQLCNNGGWLSHSSDRKTFQISKMVELYLRETVDKDTIKLLINIVRCRLAKYQEDGFGNPLVSDFFLDHASYYTSVHGIDL
ncbi:hypothetical protein Q1695_014914 [Nippostrongylus brasiliensis]|nr:hypothetical protein Q1695_014914 [Nippostrongylus brasiliensis]